MFFFDSVWDDIKYRDQKLFFVLKKKNELLNFCLYPLVRWHQKPNWLFTFLNFACEGNVQLRMNYQKYFFTEWSESHIVAFYRIILASLIHLEIKCLPEQIIPMLLSLFSPYIVLETFYLPDSYFRRNIDWNWSDYILLILRIMWSVETLSDHVKI